MPHPAALAKEDLLAQCVIRRTRRGGPGGQHRNKVETAIEIVHRDSGVTARAGERRSQADNLRMALHRLRLKLALALRSAPDGQDSASTLWRSRAGNGRISVSASHPDFPSLLAEALDVLSDAGADVPAAAGRLEVTPSQLLKFLKSEPAAWTWLANQRAARGLPPLH